ncbi:MAG: NAD-dependent deacylase [Deltaproteobacteria bacterium]|jgi:NAD-dependent deacetylase|nr:NAD-dependent deacylase [Deltaproteobacteria bacterium]
MNSDRPALEQARTLLRQKRKVVAFSGAGISTESGLSDFRSKGGIWERYRIVTYQEFLASRDNRISYWKMRRELIPALLSAKPNAAHFGLAELERRGVLNTVITQNIDGLHQAAGNRDVIELHGTNMTASCLSCSNRWPIATVQTWLEGGNLDPHCEICGGLVKPDTVSFGQDMPEMAMQRAWQAATNCDLMLMIGSSLAVQPANLFPLAAYESGASLIFLNKTPTSYDHLATFCFHDDASHTMADLVS